MKAAIYSRFSTDRQKECSIADQVRICTEYAAREGLSVVELFEDQGISGAALGNRPGALRLLEAGLSRRFDVLLVTDLSRLSRSNGDLSKTIDRLVAKGIRVVGVQDGYDSARRGHKLQAGLSGIIGEAFREMVRDRTHAALESRAKERRSTGGKCYGYQNGAVDSAAAAVVREIFERFAAGASCRGIAAQLNERRTPSPGSTWNRTERRCRGWSGSAIRAMLLNERYTGLVRWNTSEWVKDPDTGKRIRRERPRADWHEYRDESLRIVSKELWQRVQQRMRPATGEQRSWAGGKPRYLLSGLLRCDTCGAHYIIADGRSYACSGYIDGHACSNSIRVRRDVLEEKLLGPTWRELLAPDRVARMAKEMQTYFLERAKAVQARGLEAPKELQELEARIARLRARLDRGDPDMTPDEIQAAIDRAEAKRIELEQAQPAVKQSAKILSMLPRAADLYRKQILEGLDGNPRAAAKARVILRELFGGKIRLIPGPEGSLWAEYGLQPAALLRGAGTSGSGGRI